MDWTSTDDVEAAFGDQGPWVRHLALAWHACSVPDVDVPLPTDPTEAFAAAAAGTLAPDRYSQLHEELIAYWAPLLHLLCFGLGWTRADLGLMRWLEQGAPVDDPILRVVRRWWGTRRLTEFVSWTAVSPTVLELGREIAQRGQYPHFDDTRAPDSDHLQQARLAHTWQRVWGDSGDPLHLKHHCVTPIGFPHSSSRRPFDPVPHWPHDDGNGVPRMAVVTDRYVAWYTLLWHYQAQRAPSGRSIRTDIVTKPVGWMGEYRHSDVTGAWFRGQHRWHRLGH